MKRSVGGFVPIKPKLKACVLALMLAVPLSAGAVGLGRLNVLSGLGQPFRAEIDLVSVQPGEAETLVARLAPAEAFAQAQVPYPPAAMGLRLTIEKRANGQSFVSVSSAQSVSEPFLDLLINLKWADGQIQREYTALIDPVGYTPSAAGTNNARSGEQFAPSALPGTRRKGVIKAPARVAPAKAAAAAEQPAADNQSADNKYKVKAGDTLSAVARQNMEEGVSLEQMLVGLYRQNPGAFDGNMNRLRRGRILNIPAKEALQAIAPKEAGQEVRLQSKDWQAYRSKLAESVQKRQPVAGNESANTGKISPKVEEKLAPGGAKQDVLKLSKGDAPGKAKGDSAAQDKLRALEEEVAARQKGLDESNQRVAELQKNLHDMEKLLALKSRAGTELQQASQAATPVPTEAPAAPAAPVVAASAAASAPAEALAPVEASEVAAPKKKIRRPVPVVAPVPEPSLLDVVLDNSLPIGGGLAAILLGGAGIWWSRRRKQGSAFADSVLTGGDLKSNTLLGNTGGAIISTQPTENSFLTDFSRQGLGTIDTDEVDPIAEAEVYMAYDRNEQAEEILRDALAKDPSRHEIRLKLLEIFSAKKDKTSFEEIAADLFALTAGKGAQWEQAAYQGRAIDPENPLYREQEQSAAAPAPAPAPAAVPAAAAAATASAFDVFDLEIDEPAPKDADTMLDFADTNAPDLSGAVSDSPGDLDFSLDFDSAEPQTSPELIDFNAPAEPEALPEAYQKPLADFD
ncbi:MAG: type IV pilus assembly protein FimV, partial [Iodobacter sp.]